MTACPQPNTFTHSSLIEVWLLLVKETDHIFVPVRTYHGTKSTEKVLQSHCRQGKDSMHAVYTFILETMH